MLCVYAFAHTNRRENMHEICVEYRMPLLLCCTNPNEKRDEGEVEREIETEVKPEFILSRQ